MRQLLTILFLLISAFAGATNYYVKNGGNDGAAGTSDATAWATIGKVSGFTFASGDTVFFNRGDTWRITTMYGFLDALKHGSDAVNCI